MKATRLEESDTRRTPEVAELQGLYGPFAFPEKLLQKIWFRGDFDRRGAVALDGRRITIAHGGRWNLLGGPDFKAARLRFDDGDEISGDVELHLHADDWRHHDHASDSAYENVVLHVVLFPPPTGHVTIGAGGRVIPVLVLLPLLHHDLEEYAADESVETLANRPAAHIVERLGPMPPAELSALIDQHATARWDQKVHFARLRIQRLGWEDACHQTALEILGYRFNRSPMLRIAAAYPLSHWIAKIDEVNAIFAAEKEGWSLHGLRPANHPRVRLNQYAAWTSARPDWPDQLIALGMKLPLVDSKKMTSEVRRAESFTRLRSECWAAICGDALAAGTRCDTLMCDGFIPLLAARDAAKELHGLWHHWFCGDLPPLIPQALRQLQVFSGRDRPACHGAAQGLLGWMIELERSALLPSSR